jgi:hypothetical protein
VGERGNERQGYRPGTTNFREEWMTTDTSTTQHAGDTAAMAADEGKHVAGVAGSEARGVASQAAQEARGVVDDAMTQVRGQLDDQGRQQKDRLAGTLTTFGDDLERMAESGSGMAADLARQGADRARALSRHLDLREPGELLDDVRRFARQRPGTFLLGALAAGVVVGRLVRGTKDAVEAAEAVETPRATPGAATTADVQVAHGQPTQPPVGTTPPPVPAYPAPPTPPGYAAPTPTAGLPETPDSPTRGTIS